MENLLRSLLLLIHTCSVLAENVGGSCERRQDGVECAGTSDDNTQKYIELHDETRVTDESDENIERNR